MSAVPKRTAPLHKAYHMDKSPTRGSACDRCVPGYHPRVVATWRVILVRHRVRTEWRGSTATSACNAVKCPATTCGCPLADFHVGRGPPGIGFDGLGVAPNRTHCFRAREGFPQVIRDLPLYEREHFQPCRSGVRMPCDEHRAFGRCFRYSSESRLPFRAGTT